MSSLYPIKYYLIKLQLLIVTNLKAVGVAADVISNWSIKESLHGCNAIHFGNITLINGKNTRTITHDNDCDIVCLLLGSLNLKSTHEHIRAGGLNSNPTYLGILYLSLYVTGEYFAPRLMALVISSQTRYIHTHTHTHIPRHMYLYKMAYGSTYFVS